MTEADNAADVGWRDIIQGPGLLRLALVMSCVALHAMDVFVIATILPSVVEDIQGVAFYAWPSALYITTSIMGAASGGVIAGRLGLRRGLTIAASFYLAGSIICALAPHMMVFLVGRTVQGLGAGLLVSLAYTMVRVLFDERLRTKVFAFMSVIWGTAAIVGPIFAGTLAQMQFWRGVYWLTIPVFLAIMMLARRAVAQQTEADSEGNKLPWERLILLGGSILCVTFSGQTDAVAVRATLIVAAVLGVTSMLWLDRRADNPLLPSHPASLRRVVGAGFWMLFLMSFSYASISVFLPLLAQRLHDVPPAFAGYVGAAMSMGWSAAAFAVASATPPLQRLFILTGPLCLLAGIIGQSLVVVGGPLFLLVAFVFLVGLGVGQCHTHVSFFIMSGAPEGEEALTAGAIPTMQTMGIAFAAATAALLANVGGLSLGITPEILEAVTDWIYGFAVIPSVCTILMAGRMVWLIRLQASRT